MWDERYSTDEYAYGKEPNEFLAKNYESIPKGKVLSLAEGEGRNAVFLAKKGYWVTAVDGSRVGLEKAKKLAEENGVEINLVHSDLVDFDFGENNWDGIISIFCPLRSELRAVVYAKVESALRNGGVFLCESYTPKQIEYGTGGGNDTDTMQSKHSLVKELPNLKFSYLAEIEREVIEGKYHTGQASVVQAIGQKEI